MSKTRILHLLSPGDNVSPFDVNMAADAGYQLIVPYTQINEQNIGDYIRDAIFSRPPGMHQHSAIFIGGWDINLAHDMLTAAQHALVSPFEISLIADPSGAYTTASALVALLQQQLIQQTPSLSSSNAVFENLEVMIFGGGPVGLCAAILLAQQAADVCLVRLTRPSAAKQAQVNRFADRFGLKLRTLDGHDDDAKSAALQRCHIAITTAKAGVQILSQTMLASAAELKLAADVNAVPPTGIENLSPTDNAAPIGRAALGIGALTIGAIKYKAQQQLLHAMLTCEQALILDLFAAYQCAQTIVGSSK